jgi:hypothetical protein
MKDLSLSIFFHRFSRTLARSRFLYISYSVVTQFIMDDIGEFLMLLGVNLVLTVATESYSRSYGTHLITNPPPISQRRTIAISRPSTRTPRNHRNRNRPTQRPHPRFRPRNSLRRHRHLPRQHHHHLRRLIKPASHPSRISLQNRRPQVPTSNLQPLHHSQHVTRRRNSNPPSLPRRDQN